MTARAVLPGSFDPPTVAHLAMAELVVERTEVGAVDLALSRSPLGKDARRQDPVEDRRAALEQLAAGRSWLGVLVTGSRYLVDIARGYDALVMGADKWRQVLDVAFYEDEAHRDRALAALPGVIVFTRPGEEVAATDAVTVLELPTELRHVSSTAVRRGADHWRAHPGRGG